MLRHSFLCHDIVSLLQKKTMSRHSFLCCDIVSLLQQKTLLRHSFLCRDIVFCCATENFVQLVEVITSSFELGFGRVRHSVNSLFGNILHIFLLNHLLSIKNPEKPSLEEML